MSNGVWKPDPTGRHQFRWWDGSTWTSTVHDDGVTSVEQPDPATPVAPGPPPSGVDPAVASRTTSRQRMMVGGLGALIAAIVVVIGAVLLLRSGDDSSTIVPDDTRPPAGDVTTTDPAITAPATTEPPPPPVTEPAVTQPPGTDAPTTTPTSTDDFIEISGTIDDTTGTFLAIDVTLAVGDAIRYRVEPGDNLDSMLYVLTDGSTAYEVVAAWVATAPAADRPDDLDAIMDDLWLETTQLLNRGAARDTFQGRYIIGSNDDGFSGEIDTGFLVGLHPGEYTVLAQSWSGSDEARLVVEISRGRISNDADLARYLDQPWTLPDVDPWFADLTFFEGASPYRP